MTDRIAQIALGLLFASGFSLSYANTAGASTVGESGFSTDPRRLLFLIGLVLLFVAAAYGLAFFWRLVIGFVQHRRACRLVAVLETKDHAFEGHIVVIGMNGCRFKPATKTIEARLLTLLASQQFNDFDVRIQGERHPVFVDGFHSFFAPLFFFDPITRTELRQILRNSTISPYLVAHIGHVTTRKQWHEDIERRKASIRQLKSKHAGQTLRVAKG